MSGKNDWQFYEWSYSCYCLRRRKESWAKSWECVNLKKLLKQIEQNWVVHNNEFVGIHLWFCKVNINKKPLEFTKSPSNLLEEFYKYLNIEKKRTNRQICPPKIETTFCFLYQTGKSSRQLADDEVTISNCKKGRCRLKKNTKVTIDLKFTPGQLDITWTARQCQSVLMSQHFFLHLI